MTNWISKAAHAFKGDDSSSPQTFDLSCECGQRHQGIRRQKWQRIVCRACGGSLFVLQSDPYPPPKEKPELRPSRAVVEDDTPSEMPPAPAEESTTERSAPHPSRSSAAGVATPSKRTLPAAVSIPTKSPRNSPGGFWKPFRVIMVVIVLLGTITGFVMFRASQRSSAERSLKDAIDKIKDAQLHGKWVEARHHLETAVAAVDRLGRDDADAKRYRQELRETTAMTSLLSQPLSDLLTEAEVARAAGDSDLDQFQFKVTGQWLFIEGQAEPILSGKKKSRVQYRIPLPLTVGQTDLQVEVVIVSAELSRLLAKSESQAVIVAVQVETIRLSDDKSTWQILAVPDSTVLWAERQTYLGIGYTAEEADLVADLLTNQAKSLGVIDAP